MPTDALLSTAISLKQLALLDVTVPRRRSFHSAIGVRHARRALLVRWTDEDGAWGLGECSCRPDPYFNGEFVEGAIWVLRDHVFPHLPRRGTLGDVLAAVAKVRGWNFTVAALLDAAFDLLRRNGHADAYDRRPAAPQTRIPVGVSLGLFDAPDEAVERVGEAVAAGFRRIKLKVSPRMNRDTLVAVRDAFPAATLGFDANGSCAEGDLPFLETLAAFRPVFLEQPFAPDRLDLCAALRAHRPGLRLCLDESIDGLGALIAAHRLGALDELNLKPGRVGGPPATVRILEYCDEHALPVWVGGMFETGIGRAANLRVAALLPEAHAHDLSPPRCYFNEDVVEPPLEMDAQGYIDLGDGRPVTPDESALERLCTRQIVLTKT